MPASLAGEHLPPSNVDNSDTITPSVLTEMPTALPTGTSSLGSSAAEAAGANMSDASISAAALFNLKNLNFPAPPDLSVRGLDRPFNMSRENQRISRKKYPSAHSKSFQSPVFAPFLEVRKNFLPER